MAQVEFRVFRHCVSHLVTSRAQCVIALIEIKKAALHLREP
jgi:hypothetical protein